MSTDTETARWHSRLLNNGTIFGATYRGVTALPPSVSHAIGHGGTWLACHVMRGSTAALVDDLRVLFPERSDDALKRLEVAYPRQSKATALYYFGGLTLKEVGDVLGVSHPTVIRDLRFAKAWMAREWGGDLNLLR